MKNRRDMKILWSSNCPWSNSGYGQFALDFMPRLTKDGWNSRMVAWAGLAGGSVDYKGIYCYPQMASAWGEDAMVMHGKHFGANVHFSMQDIWMLDPNWLAQIPHWIPYVPIDKEPVPQNVLDKLRYAYKIITFSKFGHDALNKQGFASTFIPEGTDTSVFKPLDKMEVRREFGIPTDKFIVGMIGANKPDGVPRKGWEQALDAFKLFHDAHPDAIYFHTSNQPGGFDINQYAAHLGIGGAVVTIDPYKAIYEGSPELVNKLLNVFDLTLHPSSTEGFGLVIIESQAAGTPIIVANNTSQRELVIDGKTGGIADCKGRMWSPGGGYVEFADPESIYMKMEYWYGKLKENENKVTTDCRNWIVENYDFDKIFKTKWTPFLEDLQAEIIATPVDNVGKTK